MEQTVKQGACTTAAKATVALLAGLVVLVLFFPWGGGVDTDPPQCFSMFGWYSVPCGGVAAAAGAATAGVVALSLWLMCRRR